MKHLNGCNWISTVLGQEPGVRLTPQRGERATKYTVYVSEKVVPSLQWPTNDAGVSQGYCMCLFVCLLLYGKWKLTNRRRVSLEPDRKPEICCKPILANSISSGYLKFQSLFLELNLNLWSFWWKTKSKSENIWSWGEYISYFELHTLNSKNMFFWKSTPAKLLALLTRALYQIKKCFFSHRCKKELADNHCQWLNSRATVSSCF